MVKFVVGPGTKNCIIGLGLSEKNVQRIRAGEPIAIDLLELGLPWQGKIVIFHGETELKIKVARSFAPPPSNEVKGINYYGRIPRGSSPASH